MVILRHAMRQYCIHVTNVWAFSVKQDYLMVRKTNPNIRGLGDSLMFLSTVEECRRLVNAERVTIH